MAEDDVTRERPAARLSQPVIQVDLRSELAEVRGGDAYRDSDHAAKTLVKESGFDLVLLALKAGGSIHEHRARVPIMVQALEGAVTFWVEEREYELEPGHVLAIDAQLPHRLTARSEAAVLLALG